MQAATEEKEKFKEAFQFLGRAYAVLTNVKWRKVYDTCGEMADSDEYFPKTDGEVDWENYFKSIFETVSIEILDRTRTKYMGKLQIRVSL